MFRITDRLTAANSSKKRTSEQAQISDKITDVNVNQKRKKLSKDDSLSLAKEAPSESKEKKEAEQATAPMLEESKQSPAKSSAADQ